MTTLRSGSADEGQSFLVTISDLMAGLIFLFIITLMIFVLRYGSAVVRVESGGRVRAELLELLQERLRDAGLVVEIDPLHGVLRLTEQSINFDIGAAAPRVEHRSRVDTVAAILSDVLPCFVRDPGPLECDPVLLGRLDTALYAATIDAVLIEGHTDARRVLGGRFPSNLELAGARAATILRMMSETAIGLDSLRNSKGARILSISGYGPRRLLDESDPLSEANRRIDLRFIMEPPDRGDEPGSAVTVTTGGAR